MDRHDDPSTIAPKAPEFHRSCKELASERCGTVTAHNGSITAKLLDYGNRAEKGLERGQIALITEDGHVATLLENQVSTGDLSTLATRISIERVKSGYLLIGYQQWTEDDLIAIFDFALPGAEASFSYRDHIKHIIN